jgi:hypothetical protein
MGCLRIGTLHDYRRAEHRRGIADPKEGTKQVDHRISSLYVADSNDPEWKRSKDYRALETFRLIHIENSKNIRIENVSMAQRFDAPDCYLYCLSSERSSRMYQEFEGSDSCVEISDPGAFFEHVTRTLNCLVGAKFQGVHRVTYTERDQKWNGSNWGDDPALIKEPWFRAQAELRAVWTPTSPQPIEPIVLGNFRIPSCCSRINLR